VRIHDRPDRRSVVPDSVDADDTTGIRQPSRLMVDKITTVPRSKLGKLGERVGRLSDDDMTRLGRSIAVFLGLRVVLMSRVSDASTVGTARRVRAVAGATCALRVP
jgi:hypothetical protein